jgi:GT2 family glycosyltransferase
MNTQPLFSIIVPVYQTEAYLAECLESLLAQDCSDLEVICINDGSTDGSAAILDDYAKRDGRIRVFNQKNSGPSASRNKGITAANGQYILFVDSDDFLASQTCSLLDSEFCQNNAEIITFGALTYPDDRYDPYLADLLSPQDGLYRGFDPRLLFREKSHPFACRSAFSSSFLARTGLRFDETLRFGEDEAFYFLAYPQSRCTQLLSAKLYYYRASRSDSLTNTRRGQNQRRIQEHIQVVQKVLAGWQNLGLLGVCGDVAVGDVGAGGVGAGDADRAGDCDANSNSGCHTVGHTATHTATHSAGHTADCASWLWEWVLEFLAYDIANSEPDAQSELMYNFCSVISPYLQSDDLPRLSLMSASKSILRTVLSSASQTQPSISHFQLQRYRLARRLRLLRDA